MKKILWVLKRKESNKALLTFTTIRCFWLSDDRMILIDGLIDSFLLQDIFNNVGFYRKYFVGCCFLYSVFSKFNIFWCFTLCWFLYHHLPKIIVKPIIFKFVRKQKNCLIFSNVLYAFWKHRKKLNSANILGRCLLNKKLLESRHLCQDLIQCLPYYQAFR